MYYSEDEIQILTGFLSEFMVDGAVSVEVRCKYLGICDRVANKTLNSGDLQGVCEALDLVVSAVQLNRESCSVLLGLLAKTRQMLHGRS